MTAVEWLYDKLKLSLPEEMKVLRGLVVVALEMEYEQIVDAYYYDPNSNEIKDDGEQYYNETYKKDKP